MSLGEDFNGCMSTPDMSLVGIGEELGSVEDFDWQVVCVFPVRLRDKECVKYGR